MALLLCWHQPWSFPLPFTPEHHCFYKRLILLGPDLKLVTEQGYLFGQRGFQRYGHCYLNISMKGQLHCTSIDLGKGVALVQMIPG